MDFWFRYGYFLFLGKYNKKSVKEFRMLVRFDGL